MAFIKAATLQEIPPGTSKQVTIDKRTVALFNVGGTFYALDDACPHRGAPLWEGDCQGNEVICPWHGARFDVTTGQHLSPPARQGVQSHKVQIVGDEVQVELT